MAEGNEKLLSANIHVANKTNKDIYALEEIKYKSYLCYNTERDCINYFPNMYKLFLLINSFIEQTVMLNLLVQLQCLPNSFIS